MHIQNIEPNLQIIKEVTQYLILSGVHRNSLVLSQEVGGQKKVSQPHTLLSQGDLEVNWQVNSLYHKSNHRDVHLPEQITLLFLGFPFTLIRIVYHKSSWNWPTKIHVAPFEADKIRVSISQMKTL